MMMLAARVTVLLMIGLAAWLLARKRSASFRHAILLCSVVAALLMPIAPRVTPYSLPVTVARQQFTPARLARQTAAPVPTTSVAESARPIPFFAIWSCVALLLLARTARSTIAAELLRRRSSGNTTDAIASAATVGIWRPIVLISTLRAWSDDELRAVIAHERCHVARRDPAVQLIFEVAAAIYWFNPLIWIVRRLAALDRERACDDAVLSQGFNAKSYAGMLVQLASRGRAIGIPISRTVELEQRLHAIVEDRPRKPVTRKTIGAIAVLTIAAASSIAAVTIALPIDDPLSERLPAVAAPSSAIVPASPADAALLATLIDASKKPKTWEGDLVAERAQWALSLARNGALLEPLREALDDRDWRVRAYAAWALGQTGDQQSVPRLIALLDDPVWRMRAMAAFALRASADPRAADAMLRARGDSAWQVRIEVPGYLGALGDPRYRPILETMTADRHIAVRSAAEEALNP